VSARALAALPILLAACRFDAGGLPGGDGGAPVDAEAPRTDADETCPTPVRVQLSVDSATAPLSPGQPFAHVLIGDLVELSAAGSCVQRGPISYEWQISPLDGTRQTALPDLTAETLTVYPVTAQQYTVSLTVRDGDGASQVLQVFGFEAHGFARLDGIADGEIRDLSAGGGSLWIAARSGAYRASLEAPEGGFFALADEIDGDALPDRTRAIFYDPVTSQVWVGDERASDDVWRIDLNQVPPSSQAVELDDDDALGDSATVFAIARLAAGVALATDRGLTWCDDQDDGCEGRLAPEGVEVRALAYPRWAGAARLYDVGADGAPSDPFPGGGDAKIRALAVDAAAGELWIGADGGGIARADAATGAPIEVYTKALSGLESDKIFALAVETTGRFAGDVWAATESGVSRFVRAREVWITLGNNQGLAQRNKLRAIAVDEAAGRRVIFAGSTNGLVYIRAP
jgi:hypothetical protein